ncbi:Uncharacterised protein [Mycobacteroides abscessus subsp. abscessus]|nr:Uncharacterised protein [Mycobacteroides abscessus subsp. abscessus]
MYTSKCTRFLTPLASGTRLTQMSTALPRRMNASPASSTSTSPPMAVAQNLATGTGDVASMQKSLRLALAAGWDPRSDTEES